MIAFIPIVIVFATLQRFFFKASKRAPSRADLHGVPCVLPRFIDYTVVPGEVVSYRRGRVVARRGGLFGRTDRRLRCAWLRRPSARRRPTDRRCPGVHCVGLAKYQALVAEVGHDLDAAVCLDVLLDGAQLGTTSGRRARWTHRRLADVHRVGQLDPRCLGVAAPP